MNRILEKLFWILIDNPRIENFSFESEKAGLTQINFSWRIWDNNDASLVFLT